MELPLGLGHVSLEISVAYVHRISDTFWKVVYRIYRLDSQNIDSSCALRARGGVVDTTRFYSMVLCHKGRALGLTKGHTADSRTQFLALPRKPFR